MNAQSKHDQNVVRSVRVLQASGFRCIRSAGHDVWDLVGIGPAGIVLVLVKTEEGLDTMEMEAACRFPAPANCVKLVHVWQDDAELPEAEIIGDVNPYV